MTKNRHTDRKTPLKQRAVQFVEGFTINTNNMPKKKNRQIGGLFYISW